MLSMVWVWPTSPGAVGQSARVCMPTMRSAAQGAAEGAMMADYYHGGPPGLKVILPSEQPGAPTLADYGVGAACRRDRVYVTTSYQAAAMYAAMVPQGVVYRVLPKGELEKDADFLDTGDGTVQSYCCPWALVVRSYRLSEADRRTVRQALGVAR